MTREKRVVTASRLVAPLVGGWFGARKVEVQLGKLGSEVKLGTLP